MKSTRRDGAWVAVESRARVLGIDPGTRIAGYAVVEFDLRHESTILDAGVLRLSEDLPLSVRLRQLHDDVCELIAEHAPTHMAVEAVFAHTAHARTAIQMAHGRGVVLLAAEARGLAVAELPPAEVKKALTGNGRASKEQMQHAVMRQCGLATAPEPPDVADAIAIALCGGRRLRSLVG
jgi:crossover junction endodeoxyribonuclease RuvC